MGENVFHKAQIGFQSGTMAALGSSVAATRILPVTEVISPELDRGTAWPQEDYGRNIANAAGRGYHGLRAATFSISGELTFEMAMHLFEMHYAGSIVPTGTNPYTWGYLLEAVAPTLKPATIETGADQSQEQYDLESCLIDELTLGFDALAAPGASPWTFEASGLAVDRVQAAMTAALSSIAVETMQGHRSLLKEGTTATAFAALAELAGSLIQFSITTRRSLILRPYGSSGDKATRMGFSEKSTGEISAMVAVGATSKTNIHDIYNVSGSVAGERRWRITVPGTSPNNADLDLRVGFMKVDRGERDGESTYEITGELVDDATLGGGAKWTVVNAISAL